MLVIIYDEFRREIDFLLPKGGVCVKTPTGVEVDPGQLGHPRLGSLELLQPAHQRVVHVAVAALRDERPPVLQSRDGRNTFPIFGWFLVV